MVGLALAILITSMGVAPVHAEHAIGEWTSIYDNQPSWYSFRVGGDDPLHNYVSISAYSMPAGAATFQVFSGGDWSMWETLASGDWMGAGTAEDNAPERWAGELARGTYFIRMQPRGAGEVLLSVTGEGVYHTKSYDYAPSSDTFIVDQPDFEVAPQAVVVQQQNPTNPTNPTSTFTAVQSQPANLHEEEMEMVPGQWMDVDNNEPMWYTFNVGRKADSGTSHVLISLFAEPRGGMFEVFNAENANAWVTPLEGDWFGAGASDDDGIYRWAGDLVPGAYYVRLSPQGIRECMLAVSGEVVEY